MGKKTGDDQKESAPPLPPPHVAQPWRTENSGHPLTLDEREQRAQWRKDWYAEELASAAERRRRYLESRARNR